MKTELCCIERQIFDWEDEPYILIAPAEITKATMKEFIALIKMYGKAANACPVCGKSIIDLNVWSSLKAWAYNVQETNADLTFIIGAKLLTAKNHCSRFIEIGLVNFETDFGYKITKVIYTGGKVLTEVSCTTIII